MHWRQLAHGPDLRNRLEAASAAGGVTAFCTGMDPGFINDCLAMTMASTTGRIRQVRTLEVIDYDTYTSPATLRGMGFGRESGEDSDAAAESLIPSWGCAIWLVADSLGVEVDEITLHVETALATTTYTSTGGLRISRGSVAGMRWALAGDVSGSTKILATHVGRVGAHVAPGWPQIGTAGGYRIEVDGMPPVHAELPLGLPGGTGTCLDDSVVMTAARCVNSIGVTVEAPAGYPPLGEMPIFGGGSAWSATVVAVGNPCARERPRSPDYRGIEPVPAHTRS